MYAGEVIRSTEEVNAGAELYAKDVRCITKPIVVQQWLNLVVVIALSYRWRDIGGTFFNECATSSFPQP